MNRLRDLTARIFGVPQEQDPAARTRAAAEANRQILEQGQQRARQGLVLDADAMARASQTMRPALLQQGQDAQDLGIRGRKAEVDLQQLIEASRGDEVRQTQQQTGAIAKDLIGAGADASNKVTRGEHEAHRDFTLPGVLKLAGMATGADRDMQRAMFGETPFSEQILGHVARQSDADRALQAEIARRGWQGGMLRDMALAGLVLGNVL